MGVVEHVTARHPLAEIREGDVFVGNDAYTGGGTHLPDIVMIEPIFYEGAVVRGRRTSRTTRTSSTAATRTSSRKACASRPCGSTARARCSRTCSI